jgi:pyridoxal phosphate enzyme (YggS family)
MNSKMSISENITTLKSQLPNTVTLVAVSKTKPISELMQAYDAGQRIFGENKIQEMEVKWKQMPNDVEWHMIGHVQRNKVKYMAPFVHLIHAVDSIKLLREINKEAKKHQRVIHCLLQIKIAEEDSKYGMDEQSASNLLASEEVMGFENIKIMGLMGMATFTDNETQLTQEFKKLKTFFAACQKKYPFNILSMGMSGDYQLAIRQGSTMVRIGSAIFGERNYNL